MRRQLAAALLGAALLTGGAQAVAEPTAARYVADEADVLSSETEQYIIDKNQSLFEDTGGRDRGGVGGFYGRHGRRRLRHGRGGELGRHR
ncbi:MAG: hypothetical protein V8S11_07475 [Flavonifractor plautii]